MDLRHDESQDASDEILLGETDETWAEPSNEVGYGPVIGTLPDIAIMLG